MSEIFRIRNMDKRDEFERAFETGEKFSTQKWGGKDVEYFSPRTGFVLLRKNWGLKLNTKKTGAVYAVSKMSRGPRMTLRELYYTLRQTPKYHEYFNPKSFYADVMDAVNDFEIVCDLDRSTFVQGQPKGIFFYPHSWDYGNADKLIALSEDLVTKTVYEWDVQHAMNVLAIEKMAIAAGLTKSKFPKLINAIIATTGGQFDRATRKMMDRWQHKKNVMAFCDGDVWGVYMVQTCHIGSKASRHLDDKMRDVLDSGLYPSVARDCGCPEDIDEKKPMASEPSRKRVELLEFIEYSDIDLDVFREDNLTYELEALNTKYRDPEGNPIGAQIYITELLRTLELPCKPQPTDDDEELLRRFRREAKDELRREISEEVASESPEEDLAEIIREKISEVREKIVEEIYDMYLNELEEKIEDVTADQIRDKIAEQYQKNPEREVFSIREVAQELKTKAEVEVRWKPEELKDRITDTVDEYVGELGTEIYEEDIELQELPEAEELRPFYDVVLEKIGAKPEDAEQVREALEARLS